MTQCALMTAGTGESADRRPDPDSISIDPAVRDDPELPASRGTRERIAGLAMTLDWPIAGGAECMRFRVNNDERTGTKISKRPTENWFARRSPEKSL